MSWIDKYKNVPVTGFTKNIDLRSDIDKTHNYPNIRKLKKWNYNQLICYKLRRYRNMIIFYTVYYKKKMNKEIKNVEINNYLSSKEKKELISAIKKTYSWQNKIAHEMFDIINTF